MKKHINFLLTIVFTLIVSVSSFAQSDVTRRLYVAVNGFELNEAAAKDALKTGGDINWHNDAMGGETMLIMAIKGFQEAKVIKFLLDNGADASLKDDKGKTALEWAHQYNIGRNRKGKEILAMLETATGQIKATDEDKSVADTKPIIAPNTANVQTNPAKKSSPRKGDKPTESEIKTMLEEKFTSIYEDHYFGEKNKVEFEWLAPIEVGGQKTFGSIPVSCWDTRIDVKVTFTKQTSGETGSVRRGINGKPVKEGFCIYPDAYDKWTYMTYAP